MRTLTKKTTIKAFLLSFILVLTVSCGEQPNTPKIPGIEGPNFNVQDGSILISITFKKININQGGRFGIPKLDNSYFEVTPAQFGGTFFQTIIDYKDIENGNFEFVDPKALPDGRELPGIVGGRLPAVAVNVPDFLDTTFYVSRRVFGFFTPFKFDIEDVPIIGNISKNRMFTQRLVISGKHIGNITVVGGDREKDYDSGVLLLLNLTKSGKKELKKIIRKSKRNPNRVY